MAMKFKILSNLSFLACLPMLGLMTILELPLWSTADYVYVSRPVRVPCQTGNLELISMLIPTAATFATLPGFSSYYIDPIHLSSSSRCKCRKQSTRYLVLLRCPVKFILELYALACYREVKHNAGALKMGMKQMAYLSQWCGV